MKRRSHVQRRMIADRLPNPVNRYTSIGKRGREGRRKIMDDTTSEFLIPVSSDSQSRRQVSRFNT